MTFIGYIIHPKTYGMQNQEVHLEKLQLQNTQLTLIFCQLCICHWDSLYMSPDAFSQSFIIGAIGIKTRTSQTFIYGNPGRSLEGDSISQNLLRHRPPGHSSSAPAGIHFPEIYWQNPWSIGPSLIISQGNSSHSKQYRTPFSEPQVHILQNSFCLGVHPASPLGHFPCTILGHISHAIPHTPIFIFIRPICSPPSECTTAYKSVAPPPPGTHPPPPVQPADKSVIQKR